MKLGLYTECFGNRSFEEMLSLSQSMGIKYLEIGTGNWSKPAHMDLNLLLSSSDARDEYLGKINEKGLYLEALNCSGNQLEPSDTGREHEAVVYKTFQLAELLGVKKIVMMSGLPGGGPDSPYPVWVTNTWPHNFTDMLNYQWDSIAIPWWKEAAKKASSHGIEQIAIENHPNKQENKESRKDRGKAPGGNGAYLCFFICSNGLSGTCCISCRCGLLQKLRWLAGAA